MKKKKVDVTSALMQSFNESDIPDGFCYSGQTFAERREAWGMHAIEQLECEIEAYIDDPDAAAAAEND